MLDTQNSWDLNLEVPSAIHNARVLLVVLRCIRSLPRSFPEHEVETLREALDPLRAGLGEREIKVLHAVGHRLNALDEDEFAEDDETSSDGGVSRKALSEVVKMFSRGDSGVQVIFENFEAQLQAFLTESCAAPHRNVELLKDLLDLDVAEVAFLQMTADFACCSLDRDLLDFLPQGGGGVRALSRALGVSSDQVRKAMSPRSRLYSLRLLERPAPFRDCIGDRLFKFTSFAGRLMFEPCEDLAQMSALVLKEIPSEQSPQFSWPHLAVEQEQMARVLSAALSQELRGVNLLLHGAPGTGKTSFAQALIHEVQANGFLVDCVDDDGDEATRGERLGALRLNQMFAGQRRRAVIVLDEAEDIFRHSGDGSFSIRTRHGNSESKAWVNRLLEENPHPVIWITNSTRQMDPAYLRRFTACLQFPEMPRSVRASMAQAMLEPVGCSAALTREIADQSAITPAALQAAATYATLAVAEGGSVDAAVRTHFNQSAALLGLRALPPAGPRTQRFDMRYLNLQGTMNMETVINSLNADPAAALLFGGRPGTGKTQLAGQIAQRLGRTLVTRSASDINSMWHGQSEANVADMFRSCDPLTEVLFLDEAEILLTSRSASGHRVERAVTAEFLRWLEVFHGTFICATNYPEELDPALVRRFTFRLDFQGLRQTQRHELFAELALGWSPASEDGPPPLDTHVQQRLARLDGLTPGDFANVARRLRRMAVANVADHWVSELEAEFSAKSHCPKQALGFL